MLFRSAYKCRVRTPWWWVPLPAKADVLVTYMNDESVCLCANLACVRHLNSVHGLRLADGARRLGAPVLALAAANSVTALGAELVGRSYGGINIDGKIPEILMVVKHSWR